MAPLLVLLTVSLLASLGACQPYYAGTYTVYPISQGLYNVTFSSSKGGGFASCNATAQQSTDTSLTLVANSAACQFTMAVPSCLYESACMGTFNISETPDNLGAAAATIKSLPGEICIEGCYFGLTAAPAPARKLQGAVADELDTLQRSWGVNKDDAHKRWLPVEAANVAAPAPPRKLQTHAFVLQEPNQDDARLAASGSTSESQPTNLPRKLKAFADNDVATPLPVEVNQSDYPIDSVESNAEGHVAPIEIKAAPAWLSEGEEALPATSWCMEC